MLPVSKPSDPAVFVYENLIRLDVRMAKNREVEFRACRNEMWGHTQILL
jgi:hypothetical protein